MSITNIVNVSINVQDASPSVADFGTPCIFAYHTHFVGAKLYDANPDGLAAMIADGFTTAERAYRMASRLVGQNPSTDKFYVYTRAAQNDQSIDLTPTDTTEGFVYEFVLGVVTVAGAYLETTISYTVQNGDTVADIVAAIVSQINAISGVTAADNTTHVTITPGAYPQQLYVDFAPRQLTVEDTSADAGIATDLAAALTDLGDKFFGVLIDSYSEAEINAAATWAEANDRIFLALTADSDAATSSSSDVASDVQSAAYNNTAVCVTRHMSGDLASALMGYMFAKTPGSATWAYQRLAGPVADNWTSGEFGFLQGKNALTYINTAGINHTMDGKGGSGRFLDITRGIAWTRAQIELEVLTLLLNNDKIPHNSTGRGMIRAGVSAALTRAEAAGVIEPGWFVTIPAPSAADKANRELNNVAFQATLSGAIHKVTVKGSVTV